MHNREADWLKDIKSELGNEKHLQERMVISVEKVTKQCRKMPEDANLHERISVQTRKILMGDDNLPA